ncbi:MAG TPA: PaaI family thioesterase [Balneolales bacterium]|nr:PaaI family thioesterase [Balneolales bacterium]
MIQLPNSDDCFGCGLNNPYGLQLKLFYEEDASVTAEFTPRKEYNGWNDLLHGGIISTVLDEVMSWALLANGIRAVTSKMEIKFRNPAMIGNSFTAKGTIINKRSKVYQVKGVLYYDDTIIAEATSTYMNMPKDKVEILGSGYERLFKQIEQLKANDNNS